MNDEKKENQFEHDEAGRLIGPNGPLDSKLEPWETWLARHSEWKPVQPRKIYGATVKGA